MGTSISRKFLRLAAGMIVVCLPFGTIAGADLAQTSGLEGSEINVERATCWAAPPSSGTTDITFSDVTDQQGITDEVTKDRWGHGVAWGDVNSDGHLDLLLGTFADYDPLVQQGYKSDVYKPDQLAISSASGFTIDTT